ncbi:UvrD-helicase domain-containing protein [uncultured Desulfuromonas sp.]|uniref:UvrD-helicase domain-containing protein n=1 Tax=uncultured Desulfuromonas sp. TaxID=181013 RepID=UPI002AABB679|nr:UvrD-helicase domain-containing protein [uncultured Desulfuromonas sp.]
MAQPRTYVTDFHIHSHYSRATSKQLTPEYLAYWARIKGVHVVGSGDITHPGWLAELKEKLEPAEEGLFRLKPHYAEVPEALDFPAPDGEVRFMLTGEISNIYKKAGQVRKVHNVICLPDFAGAETLQTKLDKIGNITSDGRPILGLDSKELFDLCLNVCERTMFIPAHIWTPWFSALGAKSGFDNLTECYEELTPLLAAVEMGLSTDPAINWMCSFLDDFTLLANSDAHSPEKLGRNANLLATDLSYTALREAVIKGDDGFVGTISFFPQEGKYHFDGHRKCGVCFDPVETFRHNGLCPVCGKPLTVGVANRVVQLSDRSDILQRPNRKPFHSLIPLKELLGELMGVGPASKKVAEVYRTQIRQWGPELSILMDLPLDIIEQQSDALFAEAIRRMRAGEILIDEGYDGEYGRIRVFGDGEKERFTHQESLFETLSAPAKGAKRALLTFDLEEYRRLLEEKAHEKDRGEANAEPTPASATAEATSSSSPASQFTFNDAQCAAINHDHGPALILAGPGTGKTRVLVNRIQRLIGSGTAPADRILAITFTNKAAQEMRERLAALMGGAAQPVTVATFHALGLQIIRDQMERSGRSENFALIDEDEKMLIARHHLGWEKETIHQRLTEISAIKQRLVDDEEEPEWFADWQQALQELNLFDLDDLLAVPLQLLEADPQLTAHYRQQFSWLLVDEYQDVNRAQYALIRLLAPTSDANLFAIGDPNQAIYGFRGADIRYIRQFSADYPQAAVFHLNQSYRCPDPILRASGDVLHAPDSPKAGLLCGVPSPIKTAINHYPSDKAEAEGLARTIEQLIGGVSFFSIDSAVTSGEVGDIGGLAEVAILCRLGRQMEAITKALRDHHIPYRIVGEVPFFRREPVKSLLLQCRAAHNPGNPFLHQQMLTQFAISTEQLQQWAQLATSQELVAAVAAHNDTGLIDHPALRRLLDLCDAFPAPHTFLDYLALGAVADDYSAKSEAVSLMTLHASKGLEFDAVFIPGCEQGLLPYGLFESQTSDVDEEQRLLYVGMTRAKKKLFLSHADRRFLLGKEYQLARSPFLDRIERELLEQVRHEAKKRPAAPEAEQLSLL